MGAPSSCWSFAFLFLLDSFSLVKFAFKFALAFFFGIRFEAALELSGLFLELSGPFSGPFRKFLLYLPDPGGWDIC